MHVQQHTVAVAEEPLAKRRETSDEKKMERVHDRGREGDDEHICVNRVRGRQRGDLNRARNRPKASNEPKRQRVGERFWRQFARAHDGVAAPSDRPRPLSKRGCFAFRGRLGRCRYRRGSLDRRCFSCLSIRPVRRSGLRGPCDDTLANQRRPSQTVGDVVQRRHGSRTTSQLALAVSPVFFDALLLFSR